jgi:hypothetical protein
LTAAAASCSTTLSTRREHSPKRRPKTTNDGVDARGREWRFR